MNEPCQRSAPWALKGPMRLNDFPPLPLLLVDFRAVPTQRFFRPAPRFSMSRKTDVFVTWLDGQDGPGTRLQLIRLISFEPDIA